MNNRNETIRYNKLKKSLMKKKVKFDESVVLVDLIKDNDVDSIRKMLNNTAKSNNKININKLNDSGIFILSLLVILYCFTNENICPLCQGLTILHLAVLENSIELVKLLLDYGANINMRDRDSWSALHASASMGFYDVSRYL